MAIKKQCHYLTAGVIVTRGFTLMPGFATAALGVAVTTISDGTADADAVGNGVTLTVVGSSPKRNASDPAARPSAKSARIIAMVVKKVCLNI
jgi:hypothetical protein